MSSIENPLNLTIPLESNTESGNVTFTFKVSTSQPDRLDFMEARRKISLRSMITPIIFRVINTKSVGFVLTYIQDKIKSEIFLGIPIRFVVEGSHPREWVIWTNKHVYVQV